VPRQAGTTLAFCELAPPDDTSRAVAQRSLRMLGSLLQERDGIGALVYPPGAKPGRVYIGSSALALAALITCRPRIGPELDRAIDRLARMLIGQVEPTGRIRPIFDLDGYRSVEAPHEMYIDGQVVLALVLLEAVQAAEGSAAFPAREELRVVVDRAMSYIAGPYWSFPARDFFFFEENWHCIAARAALGVHRHDGYERFCLDYMSFKRRAQFDPHSGVDPDFLGAYGFGNLTVPNTTPAAGFAEAMSAAIAVQRARGESSQDFERALAAALEFLLAAQWRDSNCFWCSPRRTMAGGFSESLTSPQIRIDYVQHAWAGLGHGWPLLSPAGR
jgi:hypothetical protein